MKSAIYFLLFFILFSTEGRANTIKLACTDFPPFKIKKDITSPDHHGIDLDVIKAAFAIDGYNVEFDFYPWKRALETARAGQVDGLCGCNFRPEREQQFIYSEKVGEISVGIFVNKESSLNEITDLDQLSGLSVGAVRDYATHKQLQEYPNIKIVDANDERQLLRLLLAGRIDAIYTFRDVVYYRMAQNNNTSTIHYYELNSEPYYLCFPRKIIDSPQTVKDFNRGLRTIQNNGLYQSIWSKYR